MNVFYIHIIEERYLFWDHRQKLWMTFIKIYIKYKLIVVKVRKRQPRRKSTLRYGDDPYLFIKNRQYLFNYYRSSEKSYNKRDENDFLCTSEENNCPH